MGSLNQVKNYNLTGKKPGKLTYAVIGDVHLGHHKTQSSEMIFKLYLAFPLTDRIKSLDYIFINGDLFDRLLHRNDPHGGVIDRWIHYMLTLCHDNDIALRILEGTPSHDMRQPKVFIDAAETLKLDMDIRYITEIEVEIHKKTGLSILYVPDEWDVDLHNCYKEAVKQMQLHGLEKVDVAMMHGAFDYQYPAHVPIETFVNADWQELVSYAIYISHVHQHTRHGIIVGPGSFDRICHGDEGRKGYVISEIDKDGVRTEFIENKKAKTFMDIDCKDLSVEEALEKVDKIVAKLERGSYIRVIANYSDNISKAKEYFRVTYPQFFWEDKIISPMNDNLKSNELLPTETYQSVSLTKDMLPGTLERRMLSKGISDEVVRHAMKFVMEYM